MRFWYVTAALLLLAIGWQVGARAVEPVTVIVQDTVALSELERRLDAQRIRGDGLVAAMENRQVLAPDTIWVTDTLVSPPDTVFEFIRVNERGNLTASRFTIEGELYAPQITTYNVSDCDEGFQLEGGTVICDKARWGHLYLLSSISPAYASAGLRWTPGYKSKWALEAMYRHGRDELELGSWHIQATIAWELF